MFRKLIIVFFSFFLFISIVAVIIYKTHPILLKWMEGSVRMIGRPVKAVVYTNGQVNQGIKVFKLKTYWDGKKTNSFLMGPNENDKEGKLKFIKIDLSEKWVGRPSCSNIFCYDLIGGCLFQSETGEQFTPFDDEMKGYGFNPELIFSNTEIKFKMPPGKLKYDSIRILLQ